MKKSFTRFGLAGVALIMAGAAFAKGYTHPPTNIISMDTARKVATDSMPGTVQSEQLEREKGTWVYAFDMKSSDAKNHEVQVDAISGKIVSTKAETDDEPNEQDDEGSEAD